MAHAGSGNVMDPTMNEEPTPTDGPALQTMEPAIEPPAPDPGETVSFGSYAGSVLAKVGSKIALLLRWWLFGVLIFVGPIAVLAWTVGPRVTDPQLVMDKAIDLGLTDMARTTLIDQVVTQLDAEQDLPVDAEAAAGVLERGITQDWVDGQFTGFATDLSSWLALSGDQPPELVVDLEPVKESIAADPQALSIFEEDPGCEGPGCTPPGLLLAELLGGIPDAVNLPAGEDPAGVTSLLDGRERLQFVGDIVDAIPRLLAVVVLLILLFARGGTRLRWLGAAVAIPAVPVLLISTLLPSLAAGIAAGSLPDVIPLDTEALKELLRWITAPARTLATIGLVAGALVFTVGSVLSFRRGWREAQRA